MKTVIVKRKDKILILLMKHNKLQSLKVTETGGILGNIYLGRVQRVLPGLKAAFIDIQKGQSCFLQRGGWEHLKGNEEIPVQIMVEAGKGKPPVVSRELTLTGRYCVVACKKPGLTFSGKLSADMRKNMKEALQNLELQSSALQNQDEFHGAIQDLEAVMNRYQVIVRTNAGELKDVLPLKEEILALAGELTDVLEKAGHRTCYSLLYKETESYLKAVRSIRTADYDEIVTDLPEVYETLKETYAGKIRLYRDDMLSLSKLYSVETHIQECLGKKVWLASGGFLMIEPTEALCVIDVNTGKNINSKKQSLLTFNRQAAEEIARQLRIRNLSGIIIIDFVSMDSEEEQKELLSYMRELVKDDSVKIAVIDMTPLGLMEITRKKASKMLCEAL